MLHLTLMFPPAVYWRGVNANIGRKPRAFLSVIYVVLDVCSGLGDGIALLVASTLG